jgi:membrane protease YdiL (CAAX protease family)
MLAKLGVAVAYVAFALTFRGPKSRFWQRMTGTGALLGTIAVAGDRSFRRPGLRPRDVGLGLGIAGCLYGIFQIGDRAVRLMLPSGDKNIAEIYELRSLRPKAEIAVRLAGVIGPAEELFWRGLLQRSIERRYGTAQGIALATVAYGGAHLVTRNSALIGAATVAGLYWSLLASLGVPMAALIVSHAVWDVYIFLVAPTTRPSRDHASPIGRGSVVVGSPQDDPN